MPRNPRTPGIPRNTGIPRNPGIPENPGIPGPKFPIFMPNIQFLGQDEFKNHLARSVDTYNWERRNLHFVPTCPIRCTTIDRIFASVMHQFCFWTKGSVTCEG